jgi:hypothetical protein
VAKEAKEAKEAKVCMAFTWRDKDWVSHSKREFEPRKSKLLPTQELRKGISKITRSKSQLLVIPDISISARMLWSPIFSCSIVHRTSSYLAMHALNEIVRGERIPGVPQIWEWLRMDRHPKTSIRTNGRTFIWQLLDLAAWVHFDWWPTQDPAFPAREICDQNQSITLRTRHLLVRAVRDCNTHKCSPLYLAQ